MENNKPYKTFARNLRQRMEDMGISKRELADTLGVHLKTVENWRNGLHIPDQHQMIDFLQVMDCELEDLTEGEET